MAQDPGPKVVASGRQVEIGGTDHYLAADGETLKGLDASRPSAAAAHVAVPFCYWLSVDTGVLYRNDGSNWSAV